MQSTMLSLRPLLRHKNLRIRHLRCFATTIETSAEQSRHQPSGNRVKLVEVGPRDGLQNEKKSISLATKIQLIERLAKTGLQDIEAGSFVAPKWVPQMANSKEILEYILQTPPKSMHPIAYSFLAPNNRGLQDAVAILQKNPQTYETFASYAPPSHMADDSELSNESAADPTTSKPAIEMAVFAAATESFSQKNLNCSIETSLQRFKEVIQGAKEQGLRVRAYISVVLGCPFEGAVDPAKVADIANDLLIMGADEIDLGDTTGMGTAVTTGALLKTMHAHGILSEDITMHFHDTYGQALVNTAVSLEHGIRTFDSSVGGLGGCPYSPGATGNVATEDMVYFLESLGMETGVDLDAVAEIGGWISSEIGRENGSSAGKAILGKRRR